MNYTLHQGDCLDVLKTPVIIGGATLYQGDCLDVLRTLPDASVDAVVTDPPYGLSDGSTEGFSDRLGRVLLDVVLPDLQYANAALGRLPEFVGPLVSVSFLDLMNRSIGEETRVAVPESSVDLKRGMGIKHKIEHTGESAVVATEGELADVSHANSVEGCRDFILQLRADRDTAFRDSSCGLFRKLDAGRFCVPVVVRSDSLFSSFLGTISQSGATFLSDLVRFCNDTQGQAGGASGVVAGRRTEVRAVLSFDLRRGTVELSPADATSHGDLVFLLGGAEPVRASARTGGLPAKFEPRDFRIVGDTTNRAITFHFHKEILHALHYSRKGFMGKEWDSEVPSIEVWTECLRVLKPGGHLLAFGGTRTHHRLWCKIEDAGFEVRDTIAWVYGSGFPKHKTLLKPAFEPICLAAKTGTRWLNVDGCRVAVAADDAEAMERVNTPGNGHFRHSREFGDRVYAGGLAAMDPPFNTKQGRWPANIIHDGSDEVLEVFPQTTSGGSQASWGSGNANLKTTVFNGGWSTESGQGFHDTGSAARFFKSCPDDDPEDFDARRLFYCAKASKRDRDEGLEGFDASRSVRTAASGHGVTIPRCAEHGDSLPSGSTAYGCGCAIQYRADHKDRLTGQRNVHPTVKPTALMTYLCRLITPPGGIVLDPFMGSGSTGKAAMLEGFRFLGIEREPEYFAIARARIEHATKGNLDLFAHGMAEVQP